MTLPKRLCITIQDSLGQSFTVKLMAGSREALEFGINQVLDDLESSVQYCTIDRPGLTSGFLRRLDLGREAITVKLKGVFTRSLGEPTELQQKGEMH